MNLYVIMTVAIVEAAVVLMICSWMRWSILKKLRLGKAEEKLFLDKLSPPELAYIANDGDDKSVCAALVVDRVENGICSGVQSAGLLDPEPCTMTRLLQEHVDDPSRTTSLFWPKLQSCMMSNLYGDRASTYLASHVVPAQVSQRLGFWRLSGLTTRIAKTDGYIALRKDMIGKLVQAGWLCDSEESNRARKQLLLLSPVPVFGTSLLIMITFCAMTNPSPYTAFSTFMGLFVYAVWVASCLPAVLWSYWLAFAKPSPVWEHLAWMSSEVPNRTIGSPVTTFLVALDRPLAKLFAGTVFIGAWVCTSLIMTSLMGPQCEAAVVCFACTLGAMLGWVLTIKLIRDFSRLRRPPITRDAEVQLKTLKKEMLRTSPLLLISRAVNHRQEPGRHSFADPVAFYGLELLWAIEPKKRVVSHAELQEKPFVADKAHVD